MPEKFLFFLKSYLIPKPIFLFFQPVYHFFLSFLANLWYGAPSKNIFVLGVTGTKGKSTSIELMNAVFEAAGKRTALLSSVRKKIGSESGKNPAENTMPGRFGLQKFLSEAVAARCEMVLIEVTSEGVTKHRHRFIGWDAAVFLNLHPEHVEAHGSFEAYREAKLNFFRYLQHSKKPKKYFLINKNDPHASYFAEAAKKTKGGELVFWSRDDVAKIIEEIREKHNPDWLLADFNADNAAAASALGKILGLKDESIWEAFENFRGLKGRLDFIQHEPFAVVVDYAHTPDSLRALYENLKRSVYFKKNSRFICVFGSAGGGRDKWKRPELGRIAADYCDEIILTDEDPYDEDPAKIIKEIRAGIPKDNFPPVKVSEILDRREAIRQAISSARAGDLVLVTGKGSEEWIHLKDNKKIPWDDRQIAEEVLKIRT